jgi:hypothetical protein
MNTALADAAALNELLPAFSRERVKEGSALTDLSLHTFSVSDSTQIMIFIKQTIRNHFERSAGMIQEEQGGYWRYSSFILVLLATIAGGIYLKTWLFKETI